MVRLRYGPGNTARFFDSETLQDVTNDDTVIDNSTVVQDDWIKPGESPADAAKRIRDGS